MRSVLVVDDDPDTVHLLAEALDASGYSTLRAHDGAEALRIVLTAEPTPYAVVLDLHMPGMGGWELLAVMRSYRRLVNVPAVLLTGHEVPAAARASFDVILRKPVTAATILKAIALVGDPERAA
jgi:CheY-like chemotaxis protein